VLEEVVLSMIVDTICAKPKDVAVLVRQYRDCHVDQQDLNLDSRMYLLFIPDVSEENYFDFLVENNLAMSSGSYLRRFHADDTFARRVPSRAAAPPAKEGEER
jgi:hypothetical protein